MMTARTNGRHDSLGFWADLLCGFGDLLLELVCELLSRLLEAALDS